MTSVPDLRFSVAPMMDWTDRHCRAFHRTLSRRARLYTEMVTADAVIRGDREKLIGFNELEHPVALQLGGSDPAKLAEAAAIGAGFGYDEINLNCGCPSDRVQSGAFGACLMKTPEIVAKSFEAMSAAVEVPVTVKCRIGVDDDDPETRLFGFVDAVAAAGCQVFVIHARKAWLNGLSPKENRDIPPLDYALVRRLKVVRPELTIVMNGGIPDLRAAAEHLQTVDGVMLGRAAYQTPGVLLGVDRLLDTADRGALSPDDFIGAGAQSVDADAEIDAVRRFRPYIAAELTRGARLQSIVRHMLGLFQGRPGARAWRRVLSERAHRPEAGLEVLDEALSHIRAPARAA